LLILLLCLSACARRDSQQTVPQVAVLRFENLSADASLDWMGGGFAEVLSGELQGSPQRYAIQWRSLHSFDNVLGRRADAPGISAESTDALVVGANQIVYGYFSAVNGVLNATATEEDLVTHKMVRVASASGSVAGGIFPVAEALARQLGETQPFGTRNARALSDYAAALESPDPVAASQDFASATAADPDFGRAYLSWLETAIAQRNRAEADRIVEQAHLHRDRFSALDRAGLDLGAAALRGDFQAQLAARRELAHLDPADSNHHRALAEALMSVRDYDAAIVEFRRALSIRPDDTVALNMMGYAAAFSGDLPTATRVLRGYEQLRPNEPNPLDSLGDAHFALGHFGEAEQFYLAARAKAPGFLNGGEVLKAAQARLMTGDIPAQRRCSTVTWRSGRRRTIPTPRFTRRGGRGKPVRGARLSTVWIAWRGQCPVPMRPARRAKWPPVQMRKPPFGCSILETGQAPRNTLAKQWLRRSRRRLRWLRWWRSWRSRTPFRRPRNLRSRTMRRPTRCSMASSFSPPHERFRRSIGVLPTIWMMA
jgi:tetratricopeptide (TPR) repeat protein